MPEPEPNCATDDELLRAHARGEHVHISVRDCRACEKGLLSDGYPGGFPSDVYVEALYAQQREDGTRRGCAGCGAREGAAHEAGCPEYARRVARSGRFDD